MRLDWLDPTLSEGGTTVGRAWAVTIELVELCGMGVVTIVSFGSSVEIDSVLSCYSYGYLSPYLKVLN